MKKSKNIFPKIKKSLEGFLTSESGKISKKDALGIGAGMSLLNMGEVDLVQANHSSSGGLHTNAQSCSGHASQGSFSAYNRGNHYSGTQAGGHISQSGGTHGSASGSNPSGHYSNSVTTPSAGHGSGYAGDGGHTSGYSTGSHVSQGSFSANRHGSHTNTTTPHSSHGSHGSHGSHCSSMC